MKVFKDLSFKNKKSKKEWECLQGLFKDNNFYAGQDLIVPTQARLDFPNGYGISVITGYGSYTCKEAPYECAVFKSGSLCYTTHITEDVVSNCTEAEVSKIMQQTQELKKLRLKIRRYNYE